ncbi:MAG: dienelactone hydrolase family protein [Oligoflexia bacterium]|nr:dienelactone hydrolase family protein [Oligoflexia bacterium]
MLRKIWQISLVVLTLVPSVVLGQITERRVEYRSGNQPMVGFLFTDETKEPKPAIIIFSDWMGIGDFAKTRAKELVSIGYRAFVADVYGGGLQAKDSQEAGALATKFKADRPLMRARAQAAFDLLSKDPLIDAKRIGVIGFCFGGTAALELARNGAPLAGLVSFHGGLGTPDPTLAKHIRTRLLILHGADDPFVPPAEVAAFQKEMKDASIPYQFVSYAGAVHAFTNPAAGDDNSKGAAYNEKAAKNADHEMKTFFEQTLG